MKITLATGHAASVCPAAATSRPAGRADAGPDRIRHTAAPTTSGGGPDSDPVPEAAIGSLPS